jgi:hypothetical protein
MPDFNPKIVRFPSNGFWVQALVLFVIEYASILEKFNSTHHQGLRIALGTFGTTRIKGELRIVAIRHWSQGLIQSPIQNV